MDSNDLAEQLRQQLLKLQQQNQQPASDQNMNKDAQMAALQRLSGNQSSAPKISDDEKSDAAQQAEDSLRRAFGMPLRQK